MQEAFFVHNIRRDSEQNNKVASLSTALSFSLCMLTAI